MTRVFLDIDIGDAAQHARDMQAYTLAQQFLAQKGSQFGWPTSVEEMDKESKEMVYETFASDPTWSTKVPTCQRSLLCCKTATSHRCASTTHMNLRAKMLLACLATQLCD